MPMPPRSQLLQISQLPISQTVSDADRERMFVDWNATRVEFDRNVHVELLFDRVAQREPNRVALRYQGEFMTYGQLAARSNQLARHLATMNIGPGQQVAICTDRSFDMMVGLLGILKTGAAYVPLDPYYPADRLAFMLIDADCSALVTQRRWQTALPLVLPRSNATNVTDAQNVSNVVNTPSMANVSLVLLDEDRSVLDAQSIEAVEVAAGPDDLAYVIYTSGSTGQPKGVAIRRCALTNFIHAMRHRLGVSEADRFLAITTISFDIAGLELFLPLVIGGCVVLATRDDAHDPARIEKLIDSEKISVMQATPATWRMLLDWGWAGCQDLYMLCGGEAMTADLAGRLLQRGSVLWNMYGPTETTIWSTMCRINDAHEPITVGRPIDNTEIYILDADLNPVPIGHVGELMIGGVGLAREYLHRPELTAEKFIRHPFSEESGARLYRTGDLARYRPDGRIECLGRVDHQVKIRGFRVELPEIEACLSTHPAVLQAAVIACDGAHGDNYLSAYWSARNGYSSNHDNGHGGDRDTGRDCNVAHDQVSTDELRAFLAKALPPHMIPSVFVRLDRLPLTPNGKIDRRALPLLQSEFVTNERSYIVPRNDLERRLVSIWENLLEIRPIGIHDDFFSIGGHSLAAARLVAKIEAVMGIRVPVATLLTAPTVEALARWMDSQSSQQASVLVPFRQSGSRPPLFVIAGVGGHVLIFRELAELLGENQPIYGVQGIGLDGEEMPLNCMEAIAQRYLHEIKTIQPHGPYYIAGWSMGGIIAYEMAVQLLEKGESMGSIIMMDAYAPWVVSRWKRLYIHIHSFLQRSWRDKLAYIGQRIVHQIEVLRRRLGMDRLAENLEGQTAERVRQSSLAQYEALRRYRPKPLNTGIFLLRADQSIGSNDPRSQDRELGWRTLIRGPIHVLQIPGNHTAIFTGDNVHALATALTSCLSEHKNKIA